MPTYRVVTEFQAPSRAEAKKSAACRSAPELAELVEVEGVKETRVAIKSVHLGEWVDLAPESDEPRLRVAGVQKTSKEPA